MGTVATGIGIDIGISLGSVETVLHIFIEANFIGIGIGVSVGIGGNTPLRTITYYNTLGSVYAERQHHCCDVASDITLIKLFLFLNKPSKSLQKVVC